MSDETKIRKTFAHNLNHYLALRQHTQKDLANYIGVSGTTITNWVKGYKMPRMDKIDKICAFLNISRNDLLIESNSLNKNTSDTFTFSDKEIELIKKYRCLTPEGKATVDAVIDVQYEVVKPCVKNDEVI